MPVHAEVVRSIRTATGKWRFREGNVIVALILSEQDFLGLYSGQDFFTIY